MDAATTEINPYGDPLALRVSVPSSGDNRRQPARSPSSSPSLPQRRSERRRRSSSRHRAQGALQIGDQVGGVLQPDRQANQRIGIVPPGDRKSVVQGKSVSVRVDLGGRRIIKTKEMSPIMHRSLS